MLKRLAAAGVLTATMGGVLLGASPAMADGGHGSGTGDGNSRNTQLLGLQFCRSLDVGVIGAGIHNLMGDNNEGGACANGSNIGSSNDND